MAKVSIATFEKAEPCDARGFSRGLAESRAYFNRADTSLQLLYHRLQPGRSLQLEGTPTDCLAYVWKGSVEAGGRRLNPRSSLIVEYGTSLSVTASGEGAEVLAFRTKRRSKESRAGGHVHLLPNEIVPHSSSMGGGKIYGALHADSQCPTCSLWLHENDFLTVPLTVDSETLADGPVLHSHSEDEIIFVREGRIGLGNRFYGAGTAIFIAADTVYRFTIPQDGLSILNFRAIPPTYTSTVSPLVEDEATLWHEFVDEPRYLEPAPSS